MAKVDIEVEGSWSSFCAPLHDRRQNLCHILNKRLNQLYKDETKPPRPGVILQSRRETSSTGEMKPSLNTEEDRNIHYNGWDETSSTRGDSAIQKRNLVYRRGDETCAIYCTEEKAKPALQRMRRNLLHKGESTIQERNRILYSTVEKRNLRYTREEMKPLKEVMI